MSKSNIETKNLIKSSFTDAPLTPRKMRTVINFIRGRKAEEAVEYLEYSNLKAAKILSKVVKSAIANAKSLKVSEDASDLVVERVDLGKGRIGKKGRPGVKGGFIPLRKIYSNVSVYLRKIENEQKS